MARKTDFKTLSKTDLAAALDVSTQTLDQWLNRGMPFVSKPGTGSRSYEFDLSAVLRWRLDYERAQADAATDGTDIEEAKRRRAVAEARLAEMAADREEGQLLARADVDAAVTGAFARVRARLLAVPSKVAAEAAAESEPVRVQALVQAAVYEALAELAGTDVDALMTADG
jgi:phage terminase Nu1 subunit (DNA packaging protein)